jgi:uncharacterized membrane protein
MPLAVTTYLFVKALHIMAVLAAYGLPLAYPLLIPYVRRRHPHAMPGVHDVQHRLNQRLTGPGTLLILVFGAYMASKGHYWGEAWVIVGLASLAVIGAIGGAVIVPASRQMAELARADLEGATAAGSIAWSAEYDRVYRRYMAAEVLLGVVVLVAVFFMAAKPFT